MRKSRFSEDEIVGVLRERGPGRGPRRSVAGTGSARRPSTMEGALRRAEGVRSASAESSKTRTGG
jgi:hypothetical protein